MQRRIAVAAALALGLSNTLPAHDSGLDISPQILNAQPFLDPVGAVATFSSTGRFDTQNAFFRNDIGSNGRSCLSCHQPDQAMSISPPQIRQRFRITRGRDPLFVAIDGANCPDARTGDERSHSLILSHGLIRTFVGMPQKREFQVQVVHDPYGCALVQDPKTGLDTVSEYRRPLPTTNVRFLSTMMWDGRESPASSGLGSMATFAVNLNADLLHQAQSAVTTHFQGPVADPSQLAAMVAFEMALTTAQIYDFDAGLLSVHGAAGGPLSLAQQNYYPGINDVLGADPKGFAFNPSSMSLYAAWENTRQNGTDDEDTRRYGFGHFGVFDRARARRDVAAGEKLFNTAPLTITAVRGLNDAAAIGATLKGTCTTCHDSPNVGHHSLPLPLDIGVAHAAQSGFEVDSNISKAIAELDEPDLPIYLISNCPNPFGTAPVSFYTTDLGKAAVSGLCSDLTRVKGPILRGLMGRAPFFHNGAASDLKQLVSFYNLRFTMNLSEDQKRQLVAFLETL